MLAVCPAISLPAAQPAQIDRHGRNQKNQIDGGGSSVRIGDRPKGRGGMKRKQDKPIKYLSEAEIQAFFAVISSVRDLALFRLIYHRGLRSVEPGLLQISDWSPEAERLYIRRKKGSISAPFRLTAVESRC
jgi:integrase